MNSNSSVINFNGLWGFGLMVIAALILIFG
jgi:hypothetical protein